MSDATRVDESELEDETAEEEVFFFEAEGFNLLSRLFMMTNISYPTLLSSLLLLSL